MGAENGAERARKPDERERDLKKYGGEERSGSGAERSGAGGRVSGSGAVSSYQPLTIRSNLTMTD